MSDDQKKTDDPKLFELRGPVPVMSRYATDMTLRDLFAAFALAGDRANPAMDSSDKENHAEAAYIQADAMMKRRAE